MAYTFNPFTGTFDNAPSTLNEDSAYSTLCAISGDLVNYNYLHDGFLPLSGGTVTGNLSVEGEVNVGTGTIVLYVEGDKVGINTETPNEELTVFGDISASGIIYGDASGLINVVDSEVRSLSSNWESTYTTFRDTSATFLTSETDSQTLSYNEGAYELSISNGNTISLSALSAAIVDVSPLSALIAKIVVADVFNADTVDLTQGMVVYTFGAQGDTMSVKRASNGSEATSSKTLGFVDGATIAPGAYGKVVIAGQITKMDLPNPPFLEGDPLYLGSTPGSFTNIPPQSPAHSVYLGVVERANHGNGLAYVKVQNGYELEELHDILITSVSAGQVIRRNETNNLWINTNDSFNWDSTYATVSSLSSFWNDVTTAYTTASGTYATTDHVYNNFLPLSGGTVTGNLTAEGDVSIGIGTVVTFHVEDGSVGINTETPNEDLTVVGNISATGIIYGSASGLDDIIDSEVRALSSDWESTYSYVNSTSADFVLTDTSNTTPGLSAVSMIVAVSALPATQEPGTLYILI